MREDQWISRRVEKGYLNIVQELMIEDTLGYHKMIPMTNDDFLEILRLVERECILLQ